jgi:hypothetical protein
MCVKKLEQHQDELKNTYNIEVNEHAVNSEWGMFAKSIALNRIGVLDNVEYKALYQDLVLPRNALFHSYVTSLTERDMDDLIRLIWSLLHSLANQITHESEESQEHNANHRSSWFPWTKIQDIFSKLKHIRD